MYLRLPLPLNFFIIGDVDDAADRRSAVMGAPTATAQDLDAFDVTAVARSKDRRDLRRPKGGNNYRPHGDSTGIGAAHLDRRRAGRAVLGEVDTDDAVERP